jgi:anti-sigma B factor antagonist
LNDVAVLAPHGWMMGGDETEALERTIRELVDGGNRRLVIDLGDVSMMNSTALGVLTAARADYRSRGGSIALCRVDAKIQHILLITKLAFLFDVFPDEKEALASFLQTQSA